MSSIFPSNNPLVVQTDDEEVTEGQGQGSVFPGSSGVNVGRGDAQEIEFQDTANVGLTLGVDFTVTPLINGSERVTATVDASSVPGGGSVLPDEHISVSFSPSSVESGSSGSTTVTGTISVNSPYTFRGTGDENNGIAGGDTLEVLDGGFTKQTINHTLTSNTFTFVVSQAEKASPQTYTIIAGDVFATYDNKFYSTALSTTWHVVTPPPHYFSQIATSVPTNNAAMTDEGDFRNGVTVGLDATTGGTGMAYVALPTRSAGYTFKSGELFLSSTAITTGYSQTGYTLYRMDDFINGTAGTLNVTITET